MVIESFQKPAHFIGLLPMRDELGRTPPAIVTVDSAFGLIPLTSLTGTTPARASPPKMLLGMSHFCANLVSMTRIKNTPSAQTSQPRSARVPQPGHWLLQDAKARFSELVRRVRSEGPQHVTVYGRDEVVVISAEEFRRLKGDPTGAALIAAMQASPARDIDIEPLRVPLPVRDVAL